MTRHRLARLIGLLIVVTLVTGAASACGVQRQGAPLKIVTSFPMRGVAAGVSIVNAIEMALAESNGLVAGRPVELVKLDGGDERGLWSPELERANIEKAVADPSVIAYIGPFNSGAAKVSIPIASRAGLLQISPSAAWPGLTKVGFAPGEPAKFYPTGQRTFYRVCPTDDVQAQAAVQWAKSMKFQRVYILDDGEAYGKGLADLFEQRAKLAGLTVRGHETINTTATDFIGVMSRLWLTPQPDLVYFSGYAPNGVIPLLKQMRTAKPAITSAFMGADKLVDTTFVEGTGEYAEGIYATLLGMPPSELTGAGLAFAQAYQEKYKRPPEAWAVYGYDAAKVVVKALEGAPTRDRAGVLGAVALLPKFKGASGDFSFDQNGDTTLSMVSGLHIKDGRFQFVQVLTGAR